MSMRLRDKSRQLAIGLLVREERDRELMLSIALQAREHVARFGMGRAARYLAWRVVHRLAGYMPYQGFVLPASRAHGRKAVAANGFVCRELALEELGRYAGDSAYDLSERFVSEAKLRGDCCVGVFAGERLVSYSFNSRTPTNIDPDFRYEFPKGWVYHFKALTLREWRGQGLHARQIPVILRRFAGVPGFKGLTTLVVTTNYTSLSAFGRLYFQPVFRFMIAGKGAKRRLVPNVLGHVKEADGKLIFRPQGFDETFAVEKVERT